MLNGITATGKQLTMERGRRFLLLCFLCIGTVAAVFAQRDPVRVFATDYYRSDPFATSFDAFVRHLLNDPDLLNKSITRKTDTTLFSMSGFYKTFRPLKSPDFRTQVIFEQRPLQIRQDAGADTILMYHLVIYADDSTEKGTRLIEKEYEKVVRKYKKRFFSTSSDAVTMEGRVVGGVTNFFVYYADMAPVTVAWMKVAGKNVTVLNLSMRLVNRDGMVEVPLSFQLAPPENRPDYDRPPPNTPDSYYNP